MGEEGAARLDSLDELNRLIKVSMAGMWLPSKRVEDENVQIFQERERAVGDIVQIFSLKLSAPDIVHVCEISMPTVPMA